MKVVSPFRNELYKFNNSEALMLNSIYHMTLKILLYRVFAQKRYEFNIYTALLLC